MDTDNSDQSSKPFGRQIDLCLEKGEYPSQKVFAKRAGIAQSTLSRLKGHDPLRIKGKKFADYLFKIVEEFNKGYSRPAIATAQDAYVFLQSVPKWCMSEEEWRRLYSRLAPLFPDWPLASDVYVVAETAVIASEKEVHTHDIDASLIKQRVEEFSRMSKRLWHMAEDIR